VFIAAAGIQLFQYVDLTATQNSTLPADAPVKFTKGDYCIPEEFNQLKKENPTIYDDFDCVFFRRGFDPNLPANIKSQTLSKYYSKAIEIFNEYQWIPQVFVLFMFFWLFAFVQGLNQMTIAGSFGAWYFTRLKNINSSFSNDLPFFTTLGSFFRAIFFHFGTIAFGSLLIAIVKMIKVALEYVSQKVVRFLFVL